MWPSSQSINWAKLRQFKEFLIRLIRKNSLFEEQANRHFVSFFYYDDSMDYISYRLALLLTSGNQQDQRTWCWFIHQLHRRMKVTPLVYFKVIEHELSSFIELFDVQDFLSGSLNSFVTFIQGSTVQTNRKHDLLIRCALIIWDTFTVRQTMDTESFSFNDRCTVLQYKSTDHSQINNARVALRSCAVCLVFNTLSKR